MLLHIYAMWIQEILIYTFILDTNREQDANSANTIELLNHKCYIDD